MINNHTKTSKTFVKIFFITFLSILVGLSSVKAQTTITSTVNSGTDDQEEYVSSGALVIGSTDLELTSETSSQIIGMRFNSINIPKGAIITNAYIQFTCDETSTTTTSLTLRGEATDNAATFAQTSYAVSSRPKGTANVTWSVPSWNTLQERGTSQRTPDIKSIIQEIVNRTGWSANNSLAIFITGSGKRVAESYEGATSGATSHAANQAPTLVVTYGGSACTHISCFTSVQPTAQTSRLVLPASHTFQMIFKQGSTYSVGGGTVPGGHDFTGYVPISGSSQQGYLSVNHENSPGGVSILGVNYNTTSKLWVRSSSQAVSFGGELVKTERNCSGGITPWGTVITCEETRNTGDSNGDGYTDTGWAVEIDPATKSVKTYGNGIKEKLWALGRMSHENVVVSSDSKTVYYGEDSPDGCVYKFVANTAGNLSSGTLYVLKLSSALSSGEPTSSTGSWVQVPNATKSDRNNTYSLATSLGGTVLNGVEDVEIAGDGKIYFTSKGNGRVYRFTDNGSTVSGFQTFVGGKSYTINYGSGSVSESWGSGNDNLAFDSEGNLWVLQDGGRNHIWVVRAGHTQTSPKVELFATTPSGGEPTGITFSPDNKFIFLSIQHPSSSNTGQTDASGSTVSFNGAATIVIARKENLGTATSTSVELETESIEQQKFISVFPSPFKDDLNIKLALDKLSDINIEVFTLNGSQIYSSGNKALANGEYDLKIKSEELADTKGALIIRIILDGKSYTGRVIRE